MVLLKSESVFLFIYSIIFNMYTQLEKREEQQKHRYEEPTSKQQLTLFSISVDEEV